VYKPAEINRAGFDYTGTEQIPAETRQILMLNFDPKKVDIGRGLRDFL
jgi:hypothetical protein